MQNQTPFKRFSTTCHLSRQQPKLTHLSNNSYQSKLFLLEGEDRKGEGGLRMQGYFKKSLPEKPLITVVTVVLNGEKYLSDTIESVINQTYDNVEYIIIDGGSTDGTLDIIRQYDNQIDYWFSEPDGGIYDAWNKALTLSQGLWLAFVGADDCYKLNALEQYANFINKNTAVDYVSSQVLLRGKYKSKVIGKSFVWDEFKHYMTIAHVGSLHHIKLFQQYGGFDVSFKIAADYDFFLKIGKKIKFGYIHDITAIMHDGGISNTCIGAALQETYVAKVKNSVVSKSIARVDYYQAVVGSLAKGLFINTVIGCFKKLSLR